MTLSSFILSFKALQIMEKFFLFTVILSSTLGFYFPFYMQWESLFGLFLSIITLTIVYIGLTRYNFVYEWLSREIFYYILSIILGFHLPIFFLCASRSIYQKPLKDAQLIEGDSFFLGWVFPKGQLSLYLDTNGTIGPHTSWGIFINNFLQIFYFLYYVIPNSTLYFYGLVKCIKNTMYRRRNNGNKRLNHDKDMTNLLYMFSVFNLTYFLVLFINTLIPASSPRVYLKDEYTHPLTLTGLSLYINKTFQDNKSANSFPSGHVAETICFAFSLFQLKYIKSACLVLFCSLLIAVSTLFLRYHYFVDAFSAIAISIVSFVVSTYVLNLDKKGNLASDITYSREAEIV